MTPSPSAPTLSAASGPPRIFDPVRREARLRRSAATFPGADFLHRRAADNAAGSLEAILRDFPLAVDLSAQGGVFEAAVRTSDAAARVGPVVQPTSLWQRAAPGAEALPIAAAAPGRASTTNGCPVRSTAPRPVGARSGRWPSR